MRYEGFYKNNEKHGEGKIFNKCGSICFQGRFSHGLPDGIGIAINKYGLIQML